MTRVAVAILLAAMTLAGCTSRVPAGQACRASYALRPLPTWARAGFSPPTRPMPYVLGDSGDLVAILFDPSRPLVVPPAAGRNNKILWVARVGVGAPLGIRAELQGSGRTATRTVAGGPGPSVVDLPSPGCWSMDLRWGAHHDHLELEYVPR